MRSSGFRLKQKPRFVGVVFMFGFVKVRSISPAGLSPGQEPPSVGVEPGLDSAWSSRRCRGSAEMLWSQSPWH